MQSEPSIRQGSTSPPTVVLVNSNSDDDSSTYVDLGVMYKKKPVSMSDSLDPIQQDDHAIKEGDGYSKQNNLK